MDEVKISGIDDVTIILDRPRAINSLSGKMLEAIGAVSYTHLTLPTILLV